MSRLDNLGDYNIVRDDLYKCGGDVVKLYKSIGDIAVAEKAPTILTKGGIIGGTIVLAIGLGAQGIIKGIHFMKERKKMLNEKPNLEQQLSQQMKNDSEQSEVISAEASVET